MISVLLPSVRPQLLPRAFASIAPAAGSAPYEVVIVADFGPEDWPQTTWVVRERCGVIDAVQFACREARGDYWFLFNDESVLEPGALAALYFAALRNPRRVLTPVHLPDFPFRYYDKPFAAFPFVAAAVAREVGGLLDPVYRGFYADPDFSLRAQAHGIPVDVLPSAVLHHDNRHDRAHQDSVAAYLDQDRATFRARWDHLGEFCDP